MLVLMDESINLDKPHPQLKSRQLPGQLQYGNILGQAHLTR